MEDEFLRSSSFRLDSAGLGELRATDGVSDCLDLSGGERVSCCRRISDKRLERSKDSVIILGRRYSGRLTCRVDPVSSGGD